MAGSSEHKRAYDEMIRPCTSREDKVDCPFIRLRDDMSDEDRRYLEEVANLANSIGTVAQPGPTSLQEDKSRHHMAILSPQEREEVRSMTAASIEKPRSQYACSGCCQYYYKGELLPLHPTESDWQGHLVRMCFDCVQCTKSSEVWRPEPADRIQPGEDQPRPRLAHEWDTCQWQVVTSANDDLGPVKLPGNLNSNGEIRRSPRPVWWHHMHV